MQRIVQVVGRDGYPYSIAMTAEQADFFLKLAEYRARRDPTITFRDVVIEWLEQRLASEQDTDARKN